MSLPLTRREEADILRRRHSRGRQKIQGPKLAARPSQTVEDDGSAYIAWLHHDIPCIACLVLGLRPLDADGRPHRIEAAHQKLQLAGRGYHKRAGRRGSHWTCVPLCAGHHRIGPICCDPAQAKFWALLNVGPEHLADFIEALNAAFRADAPGTDVVRRFAQIARAA